MPALFEAYITNLGKYNEGELVGETLKFPTTKEEVQGLLKRIGVDGVRYEEFFITSFDGDVLGLYDYLTEYENLDELTTRLIIPWIVTTGSNTPPACTSPAPRSSWIARSCFSGCGTPLTLCRRSRAAGWTLI